MAGLYPSTSLGRNKEPNPRDPAQGESVGMPLEPGRRVRLLIHKYSNGMLRRGCSDEVFIVSGVSRNNPNAYFLKDESGGEIYGRFYRQELKALGDQPDRWRVRVLEWKGHRGRRLFLVKYVDHPHSPPVWIPEEDINWRQ